MSEYLDSAAMKSTLSRSAEMGSNWSQNYSGEALYIDEPGDSNPVSPMDIAQGQLGDCYFLAALGEIVSKSPEFLYGVISGGPNGSENVKLYDDANGGAAQSGSTRFVPVSLSVDNDFSPDAVNNYNTADIIGGIKEIWPQVMEEAYAQDHGGYDQIANGGYESDAMETLTGHKAIYQNISSVTGKELNSLANNQNSIVTFGTRDNDNLPGNLIGGHAYMFEGLVHQGNQTFVSLLNPWGNTQPDLIPLSQIRNDFDEITRGTI